MRSLRAFFVLIAPSVILSGCYTMAGTVQRRAMADFRCPEAQIRVEYLPGNAFRASGCGQVATFTCITPKGVWGEQPTCQREAAR